MKVIWVNWGLTETDIANLPAGVQRGFSRDLIAGTNEAGRSGLGSELGDGKGRCLMAGSWNAAIYDPLLPHALPEDIYCDKNRMSGLWNEEQPLWKALDKYGVKTCFFTGVNTDQCVGGTLSNAYNAGWDCVLIDDCCGTPTVYGRDVWVYNIAVSLLVFILLFYLSSSLHIGQRSSTTTTLWSLSTNLASCNRRQAIQQQPTSSRS